MKTKEYVIISVISFILVALGIGALFITGNLQMVTLDSKYPCTLNEIEGLMTCPLTSKTLSGSGGDVFRIDLLNQPYKDYVLSHVPAIINTSGTNTKGMFLSGLALCDSTDGRYLICNRPYLDRISAGREDSPITIYFSDTNFSSTTEFCAENNDEFCTGQNYIVCQNHKYVNKGIVIGECGFEDYSPTTEPVQDINDSLIDYEENTEKKSFISSDAFMIYGILTVLAVLVIFVLGFIVVKKLR